MLKIGVSFSQVECSHKVQQNIFNTWWPTPIPLMN